MLCLERGQEQLWRDFVRCASCHGTFLITRETALIQNFNGEPERKVLAVMEVRIPDCGVPEPRWEDRAWIPATMCPACQADKAEREAKSIQK